MRNLRVLLLLAAITGYSVFTGCANRTLAPDGPYKGNMGLYVQDDAIVSVNRGLRSFLQWELQNRPLVATNVSQFADNIRTNLFEWNQKAIRLRDAYAASPSGPGATKFRAAMGELQQALVEATLIMARTPPKPPPTAPPRPTAK